MQLNLALDSCRDMPILYASIPSNTFRGAISKESYNEAVRLVSDKFIPKEWSTQMQLLHDQERALITKRKELLIAFKEQLSSISDKDITSYIKVELPELFL